ncbi:recombinase family protein [Methylovulum sp.]|uniref:recombinase family protein n=1 Tax=Methylovulum sp. TaxID=1916980 RepID=UPI003412DF3C
MADGGRPCLQNLCRYLCNPAGKMTLQVIAAVAELECDLLLERTQSGINWAKVAGKNRRES